MNEYKQWPPGTPFKTECHEAVVVRQGLDQITDAQLGTMIFDALLRADPECYSGAFSVGKRVSIDGKFDFSVVASVLRSALATQ